MPNVLKDIKLNEVSLVDQGANPGAHILLFKKCPKELVELKKEMDDAMTFGEALQEEMQRSMFQETMNKVWDMFYALQKSIESIHNDDDVVDKQTAIDSALQAFHQAALQSFNQPFMKRVYESFEKSITGDISMDPKIEEVQKQLDEANKKVEELTKSAEELQAKADEEKAELTKQFEALQEEVTKFKGEEEEDITKGMSEEAKKRFEASEARVAKMEEEADKIKYQSMAKSYGAVPLEKDVFASVLRKMQKELTEDEFSEVDKLLKAHVAQAEQLLKISGEDGGDDTNETAFNKATDLAKKLQEEDAGNYPTLEKARAEIWKRHPELQKQYNAERSGAH